MGFHLMSMSCTTFFRDNGALFDIDLSLASYVVYQNDLLNEQKQ